MYYAQLAAADEPRERDVKDLDGRGNLTEKGMAGWISYALQTCLDQVQLMEKRCALTVCVTAWRHVWPMKKT